MSAGAAKAKDTKALPAPLSEGAIAELQAMKPADRFKVVGGWAPVPHLINASHNKVSGHVQAILVQEVIHATFGKDGNPEWALIKFSALAFNEKHPEKSRSRYSRKAFQLALDDAFDRRLILRKREGKHWLAKVVPEDWKSVRNYSWNPNPAGTPTPRDAHGRFTLSSVPIPILEELLAGIDPAIASIVGVVETASPVSLTLEVAPSGVVSVVARDAVSEAPPVPPEGSVLAPTVPKHRLDFTTVRPLFADFRATLDPIFLKLFRKVPDEVLLAEIVALADGAPPEMLAVRVDAKIAAGAFRSSGLVLDLARDTGKAWRAGAAQWKAEADQLAEAEAAAAEATSRELAARCPSCKGHGYDPTFYDGCATGADLAARGDAPPCPDCAGTGRRRSPAE